MAGLIGIVALVVVAFALGKLFELRSKKSEQEAKAIAEDIAALGEDAVPGSIHPEIDPDRCIGSGACIHACPEDGVIGIVNGRAELINPLACIGHSACEAACPVEAISLVFGTKARGKELPQHDEHFQTNQPGIYVAGELGGMGLIRNAVEQGRQASSHIAQAGRRGNGKGALDAIVVGAGPAGISATLGLMEKRLKVLLIDREQFGGTILHYPRAKVVMTGTLNLPLHGKIRKSIMSKEDLVALWKNVRQKHSLPVETGELVSGIAPDGSGLWRVKSNKGERVAANVVLALGRRGSPRKLGCPGEDLLSVTYQLIEPDPFKGKHVVVVGGGNAAAESVIALAEAGFCKSVTLSYRRAELVRLRGTVKERLKQLIASRKARAEMPSEVLSIEPGKITLKGGDGKPKALPNDAVIVQIGGTSPVALLESAGVKTVVKRGEA